MNIYPLLRRAVCYLSTLECPEYPGTGNAQEAIFLPRLALTPAFLRGISKRWRRSHRHFLLIPNFFSSRKSGGRIAEWEVANLLGLLYQRQQDGKHTVLHVSNMKELAMEYGESFEKHLQSKFVTIK